MGRVKPNPNAWNKKYTVDPDKRQMGRSAAKNRQKAGTEEEINTYIKDNYKEKTGKKEEFDALRYPYETLNNQDFIRFTVFTYRRNTNISEASYTGPLVLSRKEIEKNTDFIEGNIVTKDEQNLKKKLLGSVTLPIPSQIGDNNTASWQSGNMNFLQAGGIDAFKSLIQGEGDKAGESINQVVAGVVGGDLLKSYFAKQAVNAFGGNLSLNQVLARGTGQIINPNMELLFNGPSLRQFSFTFKFTPRFQKEAQEVRKIMKVFKRNMAPKGAGGAFLKTPNIFEIQYVGEADKYLNRFKLCALQNASINYTADGTFATYQDGAPISSSMTLNFTELTPVYNEDYDEYDSDLDGVGY